MIKLTITEKGGDTRPLSFDKDEILIGRVQGNDIVLPKGNISKRHTRLAMAEGRMTVHDLKSTNGTYVNGRKISEPTAVRGGDKIFVGDFLILVDGQAGASDPGGGSSGARRMPGPPPPPPPPARAGASGASGSGGGATGGPQLGRATIMQMPTEGDHDFGGPSDPKPASTGRGRTVPPTPPPPPPPRPTILSAPLEDDSADIGLGGLTGMDEGPPPSLADVSADPVMADEAPADLGADVFGTVPAAEEDDAALGFAPVESVSRRAVPAAPDAVTPVPAAVSSLHRMAPPPPPPPPPAFGSSSSSAAAAVEAPATGGAFILEGLLADPTVTAILVGAGGALKVERGGKLEAAGELGDPNTVAEAIWQLASTAQPPPPPDNPIVDVRLADGTRVSALFPPVVAAGASAAIRKAAIPEIPLADVAGGSDVEQILVAALASRRNLLLVGDAPAIAALAGALAGAFPADRRVVSIGAGIKSRPGWVELSPSGDPSALIRAASAFRGDHLLVADVSGPELADLLLVAARGQDGVVAALPARSAAEAMARLRALSIQALGAAAFPALVTSTVDLVVVAAATGAGGAIRVEEIAEPRVEGDGVGLATVARRPEPGRGSTTALEMTGVSTRLAGAIAAGGGTLSPHLIRS